MTRIKEISSYNRNFYLLDKPIAGCNALCEIASDYFDEIIIQLGNYHDREFDECELYTDVQWDYTEDDLHTQFAGDEGVEWHKRFIWS
jgi:hypothetical protein